MKFVKKHLFELGQTYNQYINTNIHSGSIIIIISYNYVFRFYKNQVKVLLLLFVKPLSLTSILQEHSIQSHHLNIRSTTPRTTLLFNNVDHNHNGIKKGASKVLVML